MYSRNFVGVFLSVVIKYIRVDLIRLSNFFVFNLLIVGMVVLFIVSSVVRLFGIKGCMVREVEDCNVMMYF